MFVCVFLCVCLCVCLNVVVSVFVCLCAVVGLCLCAYGRLCLRLHVSFTECDDPWCTSKLRKIQLAHQPTPNALRHDSLIVAA